MEAQDVGLLAKEVAHLLEPELQENQFKLHLKCATLPPLSMVGSQLRQALLNIIRNAVEAGANEAVLSTELDKGWLKITLADNGPGMSNEQIEQACDPFWSTKAQGTGLGLAITQQIMEEHAGRLIVQSTEGQGTRVILSLPQTAISVDTQEAEHVPNNPRS